MTVSVVNQSKWEIMKKNIRFLTRGFLNSQNKVLLGPNFILFSSRLGGVLPKKSLNDREDYHTTTISTDTDDNLSYINIHFVVKGIDNPCERRQLT